MVERTLGKGEAGSSILPRGTILLITLPEATYPQKLSADFQYTSPPAYAKKWRYITSFGGDYE